MHCRYTQFQVTELYLFCGIHIRALIVKIQEYALVGIFVNYFYLFIHSLNYHQLSRGPARAQAVSHRHLTAKARVQPQASPWGMWLRKWYWDRLFSEYFGTPLTVSFHQCAILFH
jgi:hypothetical protein